MTRLSPALPLLCGSLAVVFALARERPRPVTEAEGTPRLLPPVEAAPTGTLPEAPPRPAEIPLAVTRVFAATVDLARPSTFVAADLNGDGAQDLAVVVRAVPQRLAEINSEVANWIVQDPRGPATTDRPGRTSVRGDEKLLAVIHGHGPAGWRNPEARQGYLVTDVPRGMKARPLEDVVPKERAPDRPPRDVIVGDLAGSPGFLYWSGVRYVWHSR
jgi:hypothetical protein